MVVGGQLGLPAVLIVQVVQPHSAQRHPPQVPGCGPPGDVSITPARGEVERRRERLAVAADLGRELCGRGGILKDPLEVGDRQQRLARQRDEGVTLLKTRPLGHRAGGDPGDRGHLPGVHRQPQHVRVGVGEEHRVGHRLAAAAAEQALGIADLVTVHATTRQCSRCS